MWKRYTATSDTTITNNYKSGIYVRATGSNMGAADSLVVNKHSSSWAGDYETKTLMKFDISAMQSDRVGGELGAVGDTKFVLKLTNVEHDEITPDNTTYTVLPVTRDWAEGYGVDIYNYTDPGYGASYGPITSGSGATWMYANSSSLSGLIEWTTPGGDYDELLTFDVFLEKSSENIEIDITTLVEEWLDNSRDNYGIGIRVLTTNTAVQSTKKFSARSSEYWFSRPILEARWDNTTKDKRGNFLPSSSMYSSQDNLNTIYYYNYFRGQLKNLAFNQDEFFVRYYTEPEGGEEFLTTPSIPITGGVVSTGIYSASVAIDTTSSVMYDRWYTTTSGSTPFYTGMINVEEHQYSNIATLDSYLIKIVDLKNKYKSNEFPRFRVYTRERNWSPNIYSVAIATPEVKIIEDLYYRVIRTQDNLEVVPALTGSDNANATRMSYDVSGSYFDFDMSHLEPGYMYEFKIINYSNDSYLEYPNSFKFRLE